MKRCGLGRPYSKRRLRVSRMDSAVLRKMMFRMAGHDTAHGAKTVDSGGFSMRGYREWHGAKHGNIGVREFAKRRAVHAVGGDVSGGGHAWPTARRT